jgi:hypothetical protein
MLTIFLRRLQGVWWLIPLSVIRFTVVDSRDLSYAVRGTECVAKGQSASGIQASRSGLSARDDFRGPRVTFAGAAPLPIRSPPLRARFASGA